MERFKLIRWKSFLKNVKSELKKIVANIEKTGKNEINVDDKKLSKLIEELDNKIDESITYFKETYIQKGLKVPKEHDEFTDALIQIKRDLIDIKKDPKAKINSIITEIERVGKLSGKEKLSIFGVVTIFVILGGILTAIILPTIKHKKKKKH